MQDPILTFLPNSTVKTNINAPVSLRDLGRHLGVSHVTVSLALREHPRISESTRAKVRKAAEEFGYQPDPMLQSLARYRIEPPLASPGIGQGVADFATGRESMDSDP